MIDRLIEMIDDFIHNVDLKHWYSEELDEKLADHLLANGVIVPPYKVGDTVYRLDEYIWASECGECEYFEEGWYDSPHQCCKTQSGIKSPECIKISEEKAIFESILSDMRWKEFGKTVFLTKEEAEKALAERSGE